VKHKSLMKKCICSTSSWWQSGQLQVSTIKIF